MPDIPSFPNFAIEVPLYERFNFKDDAEALLRLMMFRGTFDTHCIWCDQDGTFRTEPREVHNASSVPNVGVWFRNATCTRNEKHEYSFLFITANYCVQKIGQFPALAELHLPQIKKYRKLLGERHAELARAIGLASHGVGIGSFVYLRRIFERLIDEAADKAIAAAETTADLTRLRMDDKIAALRHHLPEFLVQNKSLYSIMSTGIHDLTEDECLKHFGAVRVGIELILDEKLVVAERERKIAEATQHIQAATQEIKGASGTGSDQKPLTKP